MRFKNELERNITIKLGYANAKIYKCKDPECPRPGNFLTRGSNCEDIVKQGKWTYELVRHVSFVDCPGHDILMATMLNGARLAAVSSRAAFCASNPLDRCSLMATRSMAQSGAAVMDAALLLIAGNEPCPQPQTSEHLAAVEIMKLQHIIILQNKIDLVKEQAALQQVLHLPLPPLPLPSPILSCRSDRSSNRHSTRTSRLSSKARWRTARRSCRSQLSYGEARPSPSWDGTAVQRICRRRVVML